MDFLSARRRRACAAAFIRVALVAALLTVYFGSALFCDALSTSARGAMLMDAATGRVLYERDADLRLPMASTTKIMTALIALENCPLDDMALVSDAAVRVEGSSMYLKAGESLPMEHLLYGLMLLSGNDAANAIAEHVAGDVDSFVVMMNQKARALGLCDTAFTNPHGLDDEGHYTTARELAIITREALKHPDFLRIAATDSISLPMEGGGNRYLDHHHRLVKSYDGVTGGKTGYTKRSGRSLVTMCERDGVTLIAVTINDPDDWDDHRALLDNGFGRVRIKPVSRAGATVGTVPVAGGDRRSVALQAASDINLTLVDDDAVEMRAYLPRFVYAPVKSGETLGRACFYINGELVGETALIAGGDADVPPVSPNPLGMLRELAGALFGAVL